MLILNIQVALFSWKEHHWNGRISVPGAWNTFSVYSRAGSTFIEDVIRRASTRTGWEKFFMLHLEHNALRSSGQKCLCGQLVLVHGRWYNILLIVFDSIMYWSFEQFLCGVIVGLCRFVNSLRFTCACQNASPWALCKGIIVYSVLTADILCLPHCRNWKLRRRRHLS